MTRPTAPRPVHDGPQMPTSVLRRRPAQIVPPPPAPRPPSGRSRPPVADRPSAERSGMAERDRLTERDQAPAEHRPAPRQRDRGAVPTAGTMVLPVAPPAPPRGPVTSPQRRPARAPSPVRGRRPVPVGLIAAALVFVGLFTVAMGLGAATDFSLSDLFRGPDQPPPRAFPVLEPSRPVRLTIPSIKVEAPILDVGLAKDGTVAVPPLNRHNEAGWFDRGPTPGQFGPALIVGHADTRTGPSIFFRLGRLHPGQKIEVLRRDHSVAVFEVNSVEHFGKTELPVQRVYGDYTRPSLRLVTCGGTWLGGSQGYSDNVIVFASLVDTEKT